MSCRSVQRSVALLLLLFAFLHADGASIFKQRWTLLTVGCAAELGIAENLQMRIQVQCRDLGLHSVWISAADLSS